jgi:ribonucleoside-diphosphate reductase alpha chain
MYKFRELNSQVDINNLHKDKEALQNYLEFIAENFLYINTKDTSAQEVLNRFKYLCDNKFYANFFNYYSSDEISSLIAFVYGYKFKFQSFMSAYQFYNDYSLKAGDKKVYYEHYEDRIIAICLYLASNNIEKAKKYAEIMIKQEYQPATPTFLNCGKKKRGEMVSCFLLDVDDSLNSQAFNLSQAMQLSKVGGGVALNLSKVRARGESVKGNANSAKGIMPYMKILEDSFDYVDQMGQRKGAGVAYLNIFHADILDFLDSKKINSDEKSRIQTLSIGVIVPDKFIELVKQDKDIYMFAPFSIYQTYGKHMDDMNMSEMYDTLVAHEGVVKKSMRARELLSLIAKTQFESGYPYLIFRDTANKFNPLKGLESIKMSNLCVEIHQSQKTSIINDDNIDNEMGYDVNCILGSLNIYNLMNNKTLQDSIHTSLEMLNQVSLLSNIKNAPTVKEANNKFHSLGLGVMNLHGYLTSKNIPYESDEAKDFCNVFFMMLNFYSLEKSMLIAKEREESFYGFEKSEYKNGNYFEQYIHADIVPTLDKVKNLFVDIKIPSADDWLKLKHNVQEYGVFNAYRLAVAPTGKISYLQNSTSSVLPLKSQIETYTSNSNIIYYPAPFLTPDNVLWYKTGYTVDMQKMIDLVSVVQKHIDQGISTELFMTSDKNTKDLQKLYIYAFEKGLKSLYYTRMKHMTLEECLSCVI